MRAQLPLKMPNLGMVREDITRAWQELQPDCIELQSPKTEHPLERNGKISTTLAIFRGKAASQENGHPSRILILLGCSSMNTD